MKFERKNDIWKKEIFNICSRDGLVAIEIKIQRKKEGEKKERRKDRRKKTFILFTKLIFIFKYWQVISYKYNKYAHRVLKSNFQ